MMNLSNINLNKRRFLQLFAAVPALMTVNVFGKTSMQQATLDHDIVIINGWVLLKSDLVD